ncbi:ABC transporter permease [Rhodobacterales bacterium]|nr:ABC transporter permease [Rhodobacterales bacterium]
MAQNFKGRGAPGRKWILTAPALTIILAAAAGPLLIVVVYSFLTPGAYGGVTWKFSWDSWVKVLFERDLFSDELTLATSNLTIFARSIWLALVTTIITLLAGFPTAYFIATRPRTRRDLWLLLITIPFWTNLVIRTFAIQDIIRQEGLLNTALIKLGMVSEPLQILYTDTAVLIGMVYVYLPLMVLPVYASLEKLDSRLLEAASDLYARPRSVLWNVILPSSRSGLIAGSTLVFIPAISTYVTPIMLGGGKRLMMGNYIELLFGQGKDWPYGSAVSIVLMTIVMAALLIYARAGGPKGGAHG